MPGSKLPSMGVRSLRQHEAVAAIQSGEIAPLYLLYGGQSLLEQEVLNLLRERLIPPGTEDFNHHVVDAGPEQLHQVLALVQTLPFMAERRLVVMKNSPHFVGRRQGREQEGSEQEGAQPAADDEKQFLAYLQRPAPFVCLVVTVEGEPDRRRQLTRAMEAGGVLVDCRRPSEEEAANWCRVRAGRLGKELDPDAARTLVEKVGTDLGQLLSELEKLSLYAQGDRIGEEAVLALVSGAAQAQVFDLMDAVAEGRAGEAVRQLEQMLRQGEPPLRLLALMAGHFRRLLTARGLAARGVSPARAAQQHRQKPFYWEKLMRQARRFSKAELVRALQRILETDLALKSTGGDERLLLELLLVDLAALRSSPAAAASGAPER